MQRSPAAHPADRHVRHGRRLLSHQRLRVQRLRDPESHRYLLLCRLLLEPHLELHLRRSHQDPDGRIAPPSSSRRARRPSQRIAGFGKDNYGEIYILDYTSTARSTSIVSADPFPDCNGNFIDDDCEIAVGGVPDLNGNGIPDDCECAAVTYCTAKSGLMCGTPAIYELRRVERRRCPPTSSSSRAPRAATVPVCLLYTNAGPRRGALLKAARCASRPRRSAADRRSIPADSGTCDGEFSIDMNAFAFGIGRRQPRPVPFGARHAGERPVVGPRLDHDRQLPLGRRRVSGMPVT